MGIVAPTLSFLIKKRSCRWHVSFLRNVGVSTQKVPKTVHVLVVFDNENLPRPTAASYLNVVGSRS